MEESPPRDSRKNWPHEAPKGGAGPTRRPSRSRYAIDDGGDLIECSGKYCISCTTGLIADCVALCCCPCAVVNILSLAFFKIPYILGRKCLGLGKKKKKVKRKCKKVEGAYGFVVERDGSLMKEKIENIESCDELAEDGSVSSARFDIEADKVWLELYQIGHLGFGRISFTGIQSQDKDN